MRSRVVTARVASVVLALLGVLVLAGGVGPASAQTGPSISLDRSTVNVGEPVAVTMRGFTVNQVTVAVCGNLAKLGSADCNMVAAQSERVRDDDVTLTLLYAQAPPVPCPCLVWVFAASSDEFAVAPIELIGHPVGEVVDPADGPLLETSIDARRRTAGLGPTLRALLGGRTSYEVTVRARNTTTVILTGLQMSGSANRRFDDDAAILDIDAPDSIEPGQTWTDTYLVDLSAPAMGTYNWEFIVSGAGSTVVSTSATSHDPILLWILLLVLVGDLVFMFARWVVRTARRRRVIEDQVREEDERLRAADELAVDVGDADVDDATADERELVRAG